MDNILKETGIGIADCGKWVADTIKETIHIAESVERILKAEKPLAQPFIDGLSTVVSDVETLLAASDSAITTDGLNLPADSKVYTDFITLIDDFRKLAPIVEEAITALKKAA